VFEAVRGRPFYILTHPGRNPLIRTHMDDILEGRDPSFIPIM